MTDPHQKAVESFEDNDIAEFCMAAAHNMLSDDPRTLVGRFPGEKTRAMGYALAVVEIAEEHGVNAEREYIGDLDEFGHHRIDIHIKGGSK